MSTIQTDADVIRVIRQNPRVLFRALHEDPELLAEARRLILTDELLAMPGQLAEVIQIQKRMLQRQDRAESQLAEVIQRQDRAENQLAKVIQTQNNLLEGQNEMRRDLKEMLEMSRWQHRDLIRFLSKCAPDHARKNAFAMARIFARLRGYNRVISLNRLKEDERSELLGLNYEAVEALQLGDTSWDTFRVADVMVEVTEMRGSRPAFYVTAEASFTADRRDVQRVAEHAMMLRRATGKDAYAIVAAVRIAPSAQSLVFEDAAQFASAQNEDAAFWYQFEERDMEPPDDF